MTSPHIHLVGSVPLGDTEAVLRTLGSKLGTHLKRMPDGETGKRTDSIRFIQVMLSQHPALEVDKETPPLRWRQWDGVLLREIPLVKFKDGIDLDRVTFEPGYAAAAIESFAVFDRLQREGTIAKGVKFQNLPADPAGADLQLCEPARAGGVPATVRSGDGPRGRRDRGEAAARPHRRAVGRMPGSADVRRLLSAASARLQGTIQSHFARIGAAVPRDIELGYHLCYGSPRDEHIVQPKDMAIMVEMVERHLRPRDAAGRFRPFAGAARPQRRRVFRAAQGLGVAGPDGVDPRLDLPRRRGGQPRAAGKGPRAEADRRDRHRMRLGPQGPAAHTGFIANRTSASSRKPPRPRTPIAFAMRRAP